MSKYLCKLPFPAIPQMPEEIIDAIDNGNLLLFVGAGVSKLIGYPLWSELGDNLAKNAVEAGLLTLSEKEVLLHSGFTPMQVVTIISKRFDKRKIGSGVEEVIKELSSRAKVNTKLATEIATYLAEYNATIVTTNADQSLEKCEPLQDRVLLSNFEKFDLAHHQHYSIIHLHGRIDDSEGMVFTSEDYAKHYSVENGFGKNLRALFKVNWTILFIG